MMQTSMIRPPQSLLVIRRDNIGDLVCTTPLIAALRQRFPNAWIGALVNDYTRPVLDGNADLNAVFSYRKAKHRSRGESVLGIHWARLQMLRALRARHIDCVVLASPGHQASAERLARWVRPRHVIGFGGATGPRQSRVPANPEQPMHQVENTFRVLATLGIEGPPPPMKLAADKRKVAACRAMLSDCARPIVGVHISAREADRRWPDERFAALIQRLTQDHGASVVLTWAPGAKDRADFPGDDDSARTIQEAHSGPGLFAIPTGSLADLIASLAMCDVVICSDGGPVHLAAALGKPVVALFGSERPELWHPWGVPYRLLQPQSRHVGELGVDEVISAFAELTAKV